MVFMDQQDWNDVKPGELTADKVSSPVYVAPSYSDMVVDLLDVGVAVWELEVPVPRSEQEKAWLAHRAGMMGFS